MEEDRNWENEEKDVRDSVVQGHEIVVDTVRYTGRVDSRIVVPAARNRQAAERVDKGEGRVDDYHVGDG